MPSTKVMKTVDKELQKCSTEIKSDEDIYVEDAPEWLTKDYMELCLRSYYKDNNLKLMKMQAKPALGKGENYGGVLTRVKAEFKTGCSRHTNKKGCYIIKTSFEGDEFAMKAMEPYDIFNREIQIYEEILPKLKLLLREIKDEEQIFAETLAVDKEKSALIFEDLNDRNFIMPNRLEGLDMDAAKLVLRKLAKMHATSAVLNEREPHSLESYDCGMFNRHTENYAPCYLGFLTACTRLVAQWPEFKPLSEKLVQLKPHYMELAKQVFDPSPNHLNVFCHGDLWTNNVLIKYDPKTKKPLDAVIIDFQYAAWGSPAIDLFYFLNSSIREELHPNSHDELIQFYYEHLSDALIKLKYRGDIPSLHKFHMQLEEKSFYAFHSTCIIQPIQRNVVNDDADFNALMQSDERATRFKNTCYTNPYIQNLVRRLLPVYERRGLLDPQQ
ncbi:uncharacterized protein ACRADG_007444 [Cochliomyia hominivorax]